jgi:hypothetical protein
MSNPIDLHWIDSRVSAILRAPRMWGSRDAVEALILLLCEMRIAVSHGHKNLSEDIVKIYSAWLIENYNLYHYLSRCDLDHMFESQFSEILSKFYEHVKTELS